MGQQEKQLKLADEYCVEAKQTFYANRLDEAAVLAQNALHLYKECESYEKYTTTLNLMGVIYAATGNETMAIDYYLEGLEYAIDYGFNNIVTLFYNNIGSRYQELHEHEKAIDYFTRAAKELENPECMKEERYDGWCLVTYMNLLSSHRNLKQYELANKYLQKAEGYLVGENASLYKYTFLILKCQLCWDMGNHTFVYDNMQRLLESGEYDVNTSDYVQDMQDLCSLLKEMKEYDCWKQSILAFEKYAKEQNTVYFKLLLTEMWMDYYKTMEDMKKYIHLCVDHAELYRKQKEINDKERATAIDIKIQLREKEVERRRAEAMSTKDALTELGNRYLLALESLDVVRKAAIGKHRIAVGVLDIDCFKQLNDTYGHIKGDHCLKEIAQILRDVVKDIGYAYRFGGDEFIILLPQGNCEDVECVAKQIQSSLREAHIENENSTVAKETTISQGYACFVPTGTEDVDALIQHADSALYYVKEKGRNSYQIIEE